MTTLAEYRKLYPHMVHGTYLADRVLRDREEEKQGRKDPEEAAKQYKQWYEKKYRKPFELPDMAGIAPEMNKLEGPDKSFKFANVPEKQFNELTKKFKKAKMQVTVIHSWQDDFGIIKYSGYAEHGK